MTLVFVACMLGVVALCASLFMRDRPSDLNLPVYGESQDHAAARTRRRPPVAVDVADQRPKRGGAGADLWVLFATFFVCAAAPMALSRPTSSRCVTITA